MPEDLKLLLINTGTLKLLQSPILGLDKHSGLRGAWFNSRIICIFSLSVNLERAKINRKGKENAQK